MVLYSDMVQSNMIPIGDGQYEVPIKMIRVGDTKYFPKKPMVIDFLNWDGAQAGLYVTSPDQKKPMRLSGPYSEWSDLAQEGFNYLFGLAIRHSILVFEIAALSPVDKKRPALEERRTKLDAMFDVEVLTN